MPPKKKKKTPLPVLHQAGQGIGAFLLIVNHYFIPIVLVLLLGAILYFAHYKYKNLVKDHTRQSEFLPSVFVDDTAPETASKQVLPDLTEVPIPQKEKNTTPKKQDEWLETTDFSPDMKPFWPREEEVPYPFIQEEVRQRLREIEQNVLPNIK